MKKWVHALVGAALILLVGGSAFADQKKNVPSVKKVQPQSVQEAAMKPLVVDIAIDDIFVDAQCRVWVRWINKGTVRIDKVLREKVGVVGVAQASDSLNHVVLEPGAVFAHQVGADPGIAISGAATVSAWIDADNALKEKNEDNNSMAKTLPCGAAKPDLMPTYISCLPLQNYLDGHGHGCKIFEVSITIKNFGNKDVTTPFTVFVERDSGPDLSFVSMGTFHVPGLAAGAALVLEPKPRADTCFWHSQIQAGSMVSPRIRVTVDNGNAVSESLEDNNRTVHSCGNL